MQQPRLKTFITNSHVELEEKFNIWSKEQEVLFEVVETSLVYSPALQKYILSVVYQDRATGGSDVV